MNVPVTLSSTFHAGGPYGYARHDNPVWIAFEEVVGDLEGGHAVAYASGMAAVTAILATVPAGGVVVAPESAYSGTLGQLQRLHTAGRTGVRLIDGTDTNAVAAAVGGATLLWIESPTNPMLGVADLPAVIAAAHASGAMVAVDNTFATPLGQQPLRLGADLVVHSATKYLSGHSDVLLGVAVAADEALAERLREGRELDGNIPGPLETWLALRGLRTLHLRVERSAANALELARRLSQHPSVERVRYPGLPDDPGHARAAAQMTTFGSIVSIELAGGATAAEAACAASRLWVHATSLGGVESSWERRRRWPAEPHVVPESLIRLSVGIEDVEDLWTDLDAALALDGHLERGDPAATGHRRRAPSGPAGDERNDSGATAISARAAPAWPTARQDARAHRRGCARHAEPVRRSPRSASPHRAPRPARGSARRT